MPQANAIIKYMHQNKKVMNALLLENQSYEVRESFGRLLKTALNLRRNVFLVLPGPKILPNNAVQVLIIVKCKLTG